MADTVSIKSVADYFKIGDGTTGAGGRLPQQPHRVLEGVEGHVRDGQGADQAGTRGRNVQLLTGP